MPAAKDIHQADCDNRLGLPVDGGLLHQDHMACNGQPQPASGLVRATLAAEPRLSPESAGEDKADEFQLKVNPLFQVIFFS